MTANQLRNRSRDAVFLCYHSVADSGPPFLSVRADSFERQLATLLRLGFRSGTLDDIGRVAEGGRPDGRRLVFLTFDDGYLDNYATARPLLDAYGFRALIFLVPPLVGGDTLAWPRVERQGREHPDVMKPMTWAMVQEMAEDGHEFGSHTLTHARLPDVGDEQLLVELSDSRARIAERLGRCDSIAYPFGACTPRVAGAAGQAGYKAGLTLPYGAQRDADAFTIPRISVDHRDDERRFRLKLTPAYRAFLLSGLKPVARNVLGRRPAHTMR